MSDLTMHAEAADMCVWVVLPGLHAYRLVDGKYAPSVFESDRELLVTEALLQAALNQVRKEIDDRGN
jgi:DNA-binding protein YbaB